MTRQHLYSLTLSEFMNAWQGYTKEKDRDHQHMMEAARLVLSGLVKDPPSFPWDKEDAKEYTEEEKRQIVEAHNKKGKKGKKQTLTSEGWVDVSS